MTGADEGVYGWIALNYATGHLAASPAKPPASAAPYASHSNAGMCLHLEVKPGSCKADERDSKVHFLR